MLVFIFIVLLHFGCGAAIMTLIFKNNPIKQDFDIFEIIILTLLGPILILIYLFCWVYLWIINCIKKVNNERKTKV